MSVKIDIELTPDTPPNLQALLDEIVAVMEKLRSDLVIVGPTFLITQWEEAGKMLGLKVSFAGPFREGVISPVLTVPAECEGEREPFDRQLIGLWTQFLMNPLPGRPAPPPRS